MLSEISQMERDKKVWFHLYVEYKTKSHEKTNQKKTKLIVTDKRMAVARGEKG